MKNQKGITLIALVITIIVLLILAGVAIAMLSGENGILKRASEAGDSSRISTAKELAVTDLAAIITNFYEAKYANATPFTGSLKEYIDANWTSSDDTQYTYDKTSSKVTIVPADGSGDHAEGTVDSLTGKISWN